MTKPDIGFIGLGLMGHAMAMHLIDQGFGLTVRGNRSRANVEAAVDAGAREVATAREVAAASDVVMLCVATTDQVEGLMRGPDGVIAGLRPGAVVIDFGTSLPASTRALAEEVAAAGGAYLDAPLGRTPAHAREGKLNIMAAGDRAAYDKVEPVLKVLGENVFHLGASGAGHTTKLINNFFGQAVANAMAEAFAMADVAGVDRKAVYDVMAAGPLHSGMMDFVAAYGIKGDATKLEFSIRNAAKDVGYYMQMARDAGVDSIMSACAMTALSAAIDEGRGDRMVSEMVDFFADRFGKGG